MAFVSRQLVDEIRAIYPARMVNLEVQGTTEGEWDKARIGQVFSNLVGNAIQYGFKDSPIRVLVKGEAMEVTVSVHNEGVPIPTAIVGRIFESLTRGGDEGPDVEGGTANLGLGLYIVKEIVTSHGGTIDVVSSEKAGTTFIAHLPRSARK